MAGERELHIATEPGFEPRSRKDRASPLAEAYLASLNEVDRPPEPLDPPRPAKPASKDKGKAVEQ